MSKNNPVQFGASDMPKVLQSHSFPGPADAYARKKRGEATRKARRKDADTKAMMLAQALGEDYMSTIASRRQRGLKRLPPDWWTKRQAVWAGIMGDGATTSTLKRAVCRGLELRGVDPATGEVCEPGDKDQCATKVADEPADQHMCKEVVVHEVSYKWAIVTVVASFVSVAAAIYSTLVMMGV